MVTRHPACASGGIEQCVEQRPVGNGVRTVAHGLGFTIWARHGARVQMIAADHDGALELAAFDHLVERQAGDIALAQSKPADARRQALKRNTLDRKSTRLNSSD